MNPLSWVFQLFDSMSSPAEKISGALKGTEDALNKTAAAGDRAEGGLGKAAHGASQLHGELGKLKTSVGSLDLEKLWESFKGGAVGGILTLGLGEVAEKVGETFGEAVNVLIEGLELALDKAIEIGEEFVKVGAAQQKTALTYQLLFGKQAGEHALEFGDQVTKRSGVTNPEFRASTITLGRAGFRPGQELATVQAAVADMKAFGVDVQETAGLFARIKSTSRLEGRALRSLGLNQVDLFNELGKLLHTTAADARKRAQEGKLKPETLISVVESAIMRAEGGKALGSADTLAGKTVAAEIDQLKALPDRYMEAFSKSRGFSSLSDFLDRLLTKLDPDGPTGKKILKLLGQITDGFFSLFETVGDNDAIDTFGDAILGVLNAIRAIVPVVRLFVGMIEVAAHWAKSVWDFLAAAGEAMHRLVDAFKSAPGAMTAKILSGGLTGIFSTSASGEGAKGAAGDVNKLPHHAAGGWVTSPEVASIAENEPELIVPRSRLGDVFASDSTAGGRGQSIQITIEVHVDARGGGSDEGLEQRISEKLAETLPGQLVSALEQLNAQQGG
jgi:hypothetical protein